MDAPEATKARPHVESLREWIRLIFFGACMGAADIVPGISGGTMALILGIYEELIYAVKSLGSKELMQLKFRSFSKSISWDFLLALLIGIALSFVILSQAIHRILGHEVYRVYLYATFLGMIFATVLICFRHLKVWKKKYLWALCLGAVFTFVLTGSRAEPVINGPQFDVKVSQDRVPSAKAIRNYDSSREMLLNVSESTLAAMLARGDVTLDTPVYDRVSRQKGRARDFVEPKEMHWIKPWLICCGAIAISAMLLPGISGSYLLTILGVYPLAIGALADFIHDFDSDAFLILANLGLGIGLGALFFSKVIAWLLQHYHEATLVMLIGFMIGALRTVWPFWTYEYFLEPLKIDRGPQLHVVDTYWPGFALSTTWWAIAFVGLGFLLVFLLDRYASATRQPKL